MYSPSLLTVRNMKEDRNGGRREREIEHGDEEDAGERWRHREEHDEHRGDKL